MTKIKFNVYFDDETNKYELVSEETGEIRPFEIKTSNKSTPKKASSKKSKKAENKSDKPQLILEENKYILTDAAVELLNVNPGDKLEIGYEQQGNINVPVIKIGTGNKLTKSNTVRFSGKNHQMLETFGTIFDITKRNDVLFVLKGNIEQITSDEVSITDESDDNIDPEINTDIDLNDFVSFNESEISDEDFEF